jgi:hypothetical protein
MRGATRAKLGRIPALLLALPFAHAGPCTFNTTGGVATVNDLVPNNNSVPAVCGVDWGRLTSEVGLDQAAVDQQYGGNASASLETTCAQRADSEDACHNEMNFLQQAPACEQWCSDSCDNIGAVCNDCAGCDDTAQCNQAATNWPGCDNQDSSGQGP